MSNMMDIIDKKRSEEQISIEDLCSQIGVDESMYSKWQNDPDLIKLSSFRQLVDILGLTSDEIKEIFC